MITDSWLQYSSTSNRFNNTYLQGFLDVSGNIILRNGSLNIKNGDISMNGNLYLSANNINLSSASSYNGLIQLNNSISTTNSYQPIEFIVNMISLNTNTGITNWREVRMSSTGQYWIAVSTQVNEVYISSNYGTTFTQVTNSDTSGCYTVGISGNGQYMVIPYYGTNTTGSGTYLLSSDYGANWTKKTYTITTIDAITSIAISNTGQYMTMAASAIISSYNTSNSAGRLYRSTDYGITFTAIGSQYNNLINVAMSSDGRYQTAVSFYSNTQGSGNNNAGAYVKSTNYGASWTASQVISGVSSRRANKAIAISSTGQYQTIVGESGLAYTSCFIANSSDYGATFTYNTNAPTDVSYGCISMLSDGKYQIVGVGRKGQSSPSGYLYISTDYGITWTINTSTTNLWSSIAMSQYGEYIAGATYANGMYLTTNNLYDSSYGINVSNPSIKMNLLVNGLTIGFPINNGSMNRSICVGNNTLNSSLKVNQGNISDLSINVFGYNTANTLESGCRNTVFGAYADLTTSDTSGVTIVGYNAKAGPMNSTAIGSQSYVSGVNSIAIGYLTNVTANNTVRLGNTLVTTVDTSASILTSSTIKNSSGYLANMWSGANMFPEKTINITTISGLSSTPSNKFFGGALGDDGYIYLSCDSSGVVGVINPANDTISYFTSVGSAIGICKAANGKFYGAPYTANQAVLEINPVTRTTTTFGTTNNVTGQYWGCVLAPNGKIYCIPYNVTNNIGIIDASATTPVFSTLSITTPAGSSPYFNGGVLAPNGKIYCIPYNATVVGVIDTTVTPNTFSTFGTVTGTAPYYSGGVLGPNGKIYCIPYSVTNIGIIDTTANTFSTSGSIAGSTKYNGGILAPNNKIYCIPATAGNVGVIDVSGPTPDFTTFGSVATDSQQYAGGVLGPNGKIYCVPRNATNVGIIKCGIPTEELWMLGPEFNKY